jgi:hypothetical protein
MPEKTLTGYWRENTKPVYGPFSSNGCPFHPFFFRQGQMVAQGQLGFWMPECKYRMKLLADKQHLSFQAWKKE